MAHPWRGPFDEATRAVDLSNYDNLGPARPESLSDVEADRLRQALADPANNEEAIAWLRFERTAHQHWQSELEKGLEKFDLADKLRRYEHHLSHAANSYLNSGFDRALIVTIDGYREQNCIPSVFAIVVEDDQGRFYSGDTDEIPANDVDCCGDAEHVVLHGEREAPPRS